MGEWVQSNQEMTSSMWARQTENQQCEFKHKEICELIHTEITMEITDMANINICLQNINKLQNVILFQNISKYQ